MTIEDYYLNEVRPKGYPVRHRRKVPFSPSISVPDGYMARRRRIDDLDFDLDRFALTEKDYMDLVTDAYASNVHWSTMLEGNPLKEEKVRKITASTFGGKGMTAETPSGPKQEIVNHLTHLLFPEDYRLPWDHQHIQRLHDYLLKGTGHRFKKGSYRTDHRSVKDSTGMETFIACPPEHIASEMESLLRWINGPGLAYDPVAAATVFFHEFESIHPFSDGNGRTGRCLFHLFLQDSRLPNSHLCKIEHEILADSEVYYKVLAYTDESGSYKELVDLVSSAILRAYEKTHRVLSEKDLLSSDLDETSKRVLKMAKRSGSWFSVTDASKWVNSAGPQTIRARLNELVDMGALQMRGNTRSRRYKVRNPLEDVRDRMRRPARDT